MRLAFSVSSRRLTSSLSFLHEFHWDHAANATISGASRAVIIQHTLRIACLALPSPSLGTFRRSDVQALRHEVIMQVATIPNVPRPFGSSTQWTVAGAQREHRGLNANANNKLDMLVAFSRRGWCLYHRGTRYRAQHPLPHLHVLTCVIIRCLINSTKHTP